jgi:hypothetical protein
MHASFVAGLSAQPTWQELLGAIAVDWEEAVDLSVYSGGLRMLGCPKALTCTSRCKGKKGMMLCMCNGTGHVYDRRVYEIHLAMVGDAPDRAYWSYLMDPEKPIRKMDDTTVRVFKDSETTETPGYKVYTGCPPSSTTGKKRKGSAVGDRKHLPSKMRQQAEIHSPRVHAAVRKLLTKHHPLYANSTYQIRRWKKTMSVLLRGEGARYCKNKGGEHKSQNVYMEISNSGLTHASYQSQMKCWCRCPTTDRVTKGTCAKYESQPVSVEMEDVSVLFPDTEASTSRTVPAKTFDVTSQSQWESMLDMDLERINNAAGTGSMA